MDKSIKKYIIIGIVFILGFPTIINLILCIKLPISIPIAGDSQSWVAFWGAYMGGIITAVIGFKALYYNQKNYQDSLRIQDENRLFDFKQWQAKALEKELTKRAESLCLGPLHRVLERIPDHITKEETLAEIEHLKERLERVERQAISWCLMSAYDEMNSKPEGFERKYWYITELFRKDVIDTIEILNDSISTANFTIEKERIKELSKVISQHNNEILLFFGKPAREWIAKESGL